VTKQSSSWDGDLEAKPVHWRRSSYCGNSSCVEVAIERDQIRVRDSKHLIGAVLVYDRGEWLTFIAGVKAGEFDLA
jgi:hypothetical protein